MEAARPSASTARSTKDLVLDFILLASVGPILWGFGFADLVDRIALLLLLLTPVLIRFTARLRPLSPNQTAYYLAFWYVTLGALDKFDGYGDGERWVIPAIAAGLLVMTYLLWNKAVIQVFEKWFWEDCLISGTSTSRLDAIVEKISKITS